MKLVLVRHGETKCNRSKILTGHFDIGLNEEGIRQSMDLAARIEHTYEVIYSSPLRRAYETAEIIAGYSKRPIIIKTELRERDIGALTGMTWAQVNDTSNLDLYTMDRNLEYDYRPFGGEPAEQVKARVMEFITELSIQSYKEVLVVCHGGIIRMVHRLLCNGTTSSIANTSIHEFKC